MSKKQKQILKRKMQDFLLLTISGLITGVLFALWIVLH